MKRDEVPQEDARTASDAHLVELVRTGDRTAFALLYGSHASLVGRVVRDHVADPEMVPDLVQETFARALTSLDRLRDPGRFQAWLCAIARHVAIDHRRALRQEVSLDDTPEAASTDLSPDATLELRELGQQVGDCLRGLSARDATAIALVTRFGLPPADLAAALGVTPGTAKVILHRARRRLRSALVLELGVAVRD